MSALPAIVLVGGLGTRLRTLHPDRPKALVPVLGKPFLARLVDWLGQHGVTRIHLAAGYRADQVAAWCKEQPDAAGLSVAVESEPLGTGGGLRFAAESIAGDELLVLNGDSFLPGLDLRAWMNTPLPAGALASLAVTRIELAGRYGTVEFDTQHRLTAFLEKADRQAGWVNGGVYRLRREVLTRLPEGTSSLEHDLFPALAASGTLRAHPIPPPLLDMGTPEGLHAMEQWLAK